MKISPETEALIDSVNDHSERQIVNRYEVSIIIEASFFSGKEKIFTDLIFNAKYINGLMMILSGKVVNKDEYVEKIFAEFNKTLEKFTVLLKEAISECSEKIEKHFNDRYLRLTQEGMAELLKLTTDLSLVKEYFNSKK